MGKPVAVVLFGLFFAKGCGGVVQQGLCQALALKCYDCMFQSADCNSTLQKCDGQCGSITVSAQIGGVKLDYSLKSCLNPVYCVKGRINIGVIEGSVNSKCCNTDGCNKELLPALPNQSANGKKCCTNDDCSSTVSCKGDEDRCMSAMVLVFSISVNVKGCATRSVCSGLLPVTNQSFIVPGISCCEGNLCNAAANFTLSFFLMLVSLLSSIH